METLDPDLVALCCAAAGDDAANVVAHVSRRVREAVRSVWRGGWSSGPRAVLASAERLAWAESVGCGWRGRALLETAARHGALDALRAVAPLYSVWPDSATVAAAAADQLEVLLAHDPEPDPRMLYTAGPRVRAHYRHLDVPFTFSKPGFLDPTRDFRRLLAAAQPIETVVSPRDWDDLTIARMARRDVDLGPVHPTVWARCRHTPALTPIDRPGWFKVAAPRGWDVIDDVSATVGVIRGYDINAPGHMEPFEPGRAWLLRRMVYYWVTFWIEAPPDTPAVGIAFRGTRVCAAEFAPYAVGTLVTDDRIIYLETSLVGHLHRLDTTLLVRADGSDECAPLFESLN